MQDTCKTLQHELFEATQACLWGGGSKYRVGWGEACVVGNGPVRESLKESQHGTPSGTVLGIGFLAPTFDRLFFCCQHLCSA